MLIVYAAAPPPERLLRSGAACDRYSVSRSRFETSRSKVRCAAVLRAGVARPYKPSQPAQAQIVQIKLAPEIMASSCKTLASAFWEIFGLRERRERRVLLLGVVRIVAQVA